MKLLQSYKYASSIEFTFEVDYSQSGTSLVSDKLGIGGVDFMPATGDTVTVYSNTIGTSGDYDFKPDLNNALYYLVSDDLITDRSQILDQGTVISLTLVSGRYEGSFVFSNPNGFKYLYIVSDYTNYIRPAGSVSYDFPADYTDVVDATLDAKAGLTEVQYDSTAGTFRIAIEYQGNIVADTGEIPFGPGSLEFVKTTVTEDPMRIIVMNFGVPSTISLDAPVVSLTSFYIDKTDGDLSDVCSQMATDPVFHNGASALPVAGDIIYNDSSGLSPYDGNNSYHVISTTVMGAPSPTSTYVAVSPSGSVLSVGSCACSEVAVPVITQGDIVLTQNQSFSIYVEAANNPNSWTLVTACEEYQLDGGDRGSVLTYTDCEGISRTVTSSVGQIFSVCAIITPTVVTGTGVVTLMGPCQENSLPTGVTFRDGVISGLATTTGRQTIELIASNCFGDSANATFDVIVESSINLTPVAIDVENPSDTGAAACALTGTYQLLYHNNKTTRFPDLNSIIYLDHKGVDKFVGGKLWYKISGSLYSIQVDELGVVIDTHTC